MVVRWGGGSETWGGVGEGRWGKASLGGQGDHLGVWGGGDKASEEGTRVVGGGGIPPGGGVILLIIKNNNNSPNKDTSRGRDSYLVSSEFQDCCQWWSAQVPKPR